LLRLAGRGTMRRMAFSAVTERAVEADRRSEQLVAAARELADETGTAAFTVAQVAAHAGLSLKSFYRCFHGKDELLLALIAVDSRAGADVLRARAPENLAAYITELFDMLTLPGALGYAGILVREHRRLSEHHTEELRVALLPLTELLAALLDTDDPDRDAETIFSVLVDGIHRLVTNRASDPHALGAYLARFCSKGVDAL
jgi:AcrR family transcriptional regulator